MAVVVMVLTGCKDYDADIIANSEPVRVELAYTFSSTASGNYTRQADGLVQNSSHRQPSDLHVVTMRDNEPMRSEVIWENPVKIEGEGENPTLLLYYSRYCEMVPGVNRCLVYGDVADADVPLGEIPSKVYNGSLIKSSLTTLTSYSDLKNVSFSLESIRESTDAPSEAGTLADALTTLANNDAWVGSDNAILMNLRQNFINHGFNLPGSAASVKQWLLALADAAQSYIDNPPSSIGETEKTILGDIKAVATTTANGITIDNGYPRNLYLPDGAAALRWVESENKFLPQMQTTTLDNINTVSRFAYPAALYYFINSDLKTSNTKVNYATEYGGVTAITTKTAWDDILERKFTDDIKVTTSTKSVALEDPVEYAVAQLHVTVQASAASLPDASNPAASVNVGDETFPLTGIIVCGQRPVNYLFEQGSNSDAEVKFIYDSQVKKSDNTDTYYYMTNNAPAGGPSTLVLQSFTGEDVNIILEFEYHGAEKFKCIDGFVYPNTRFYLVGKVEVTNGSAGDGISDGRVFTKDYITSVNITVSSLAKAYNVLPNLLTSNLEIGVMTTPQWIAATPQTIVFEE